MAVTVESKTLFVGLLVGLAHMASGVAVMVSPPAGKVGGASLTTRHRGRMVWLWCPVPRVGTHRCGTPSRDWCESVLSHYGVGSHYVVCATGDTTPPSDLVDQYVTSFWRVPGWLLSYWIGLVYSCGSGLGLGVVDLSQPLARCINLREIDQWKALLRKY